MPYACGLDRNGKWEWFAESMRVHATLRHFAKWESLRNDVAKMMLKKWRRKIWCPMETLRCVVMLWRIKISDSYCLVGQFLKNALVEYIAVCRHQWESMQRYVILQNKNHWEMTSQKRRGTNWCRKKTDFTENMLFLLKCVDLNPVV